MESNSSKYQINHLLYPCRRACGHVDVGTRPHQVLASTLTLSQPRGADYALPILMSTPSFESHRRACLYHHMKKVEKNQKFKNSKIQKFKNFKFKIRYLYRSQDPTTNYEFLKEKVANFQYRPIFNAMNEIFITVVIT